MRSNLKKKKKIEQFRPKKKFLHFLAYLKKFQLKHFESLYSVIKNNFSYSSPDLFNFFKILTDDYTVHKLSL